MKPVIEDDRRLDVRLGNGGHGVAIFTRLRNRDYLPDEPTDLKVVLPNQREVDGKFTPNPDNPFIGGPELRRWIRNAVEEGTFLEASLVEVIPGVLKVEMKPASSFPDLVSLDKGKAGRRAAYRGRKRGRRERTRAWAEKWERDPRLREECLAVWGPTCQVEDCHWKGQGGLKDDAHRRRVVEIHHLHHVANGGSDDPLNVVVLCANHHRLVHMKGATMTELEAGADVQLPDGPTLRIRRPG